MFGLIWNDSRVFVVYPVWSLNFVIKKHTWIEADEALEYTTDGIVFALTLLRNKLSERGGFEDRILGGFRLVVFLPMRFSPGGVFLIEPCMDAAVT